MACDDLTFSQLNPELEEMYFEVCEVYYDKNLNPNGYCAAKSVGGSDLKGIRWQLNKMKEALKKPILSKKNFPNEYKKV